MAERYDYDRERRWRDQNGDRWNQGGQEWDDENQDWNRTRQWRRDGERDWQQSLRGRGSDRAQGSNRDWDQGSSGEDSDWDYGQSQRSGRDFGQQYRREQEDRSYGDVRMRGDDRWGAAYGGDRGNYGETRGREQGVNRNEQIYNRDWYNWDYESDEDFYRNQEYGDTRDVARWRDYGDSNRRGYYQNPGQNRDRGQNQDRWQNRGRGQGNWSSEYRTAGMRSDFPEDVNYDRHDYRNENLNYHRGDVGYDSEGAFYQDMDEPINNRYFWDVPGRYTGMGPQNYRRTDERINEDVSERLANHGRIDASDVEIDVKDGEVTLKGTVPSREMKRLAEDVAIEITGVQDVHNEIKVKPRQQRGPNLTNRGYDMGEDWDQTSDRNRDYGDWNARGSNTGRESDRYASDMERDQNRQDWATPRADNSPAGQSNVGAGLTSAGATSIEGMEAASGVENKRDQIREGMEVIDNQGKIIGRVKEIREDDFLVDREMARDIYVPYSAVQSVGAQAMLNILTSEIDNQGWEKPSIL